MQFFLPPLTIERLMGASIEELGLFDSDGRYQEILEWDPRYRFLKESADLLPEEYKGIHRFDLERVLGVCHRDVCEVLDPRDTNEYRLRCRSALEIVETASIDLAKALEELDETAGAEFPHFDDLKKLLMTSFWFVDQQCAKRLEDAVGLLSYMLIRLNFAARVTKKLHDLRAPKHKPKEELRVRCAEVLVFAWIAMSLVAGRTVSKSYPSARNGGLRWCTEVFIGIVRNGWCGEVRLPEKGWKERSLVDGIRQASKDISAWLSETEGVEPQEAWRTLDWESEAGFHLLVHGAGIIEADELIVKHKCKHEYFARLEEQGIGYFLDTNEGPVPTKLSSFLGSDS